MKRPAKTLPIKPPRTYTLRDAYRGRVWRTPWTVVARELFFWALGLTLLSLAVNDVRWMLYCLVAVILLGVIAVSASISKNQTRVRIIRTGLSAQASIGYPRRIPFLHELFRGKREATHRLSYSFKTPDGTPVDGDIWLCGCALKYIEPGSKNRSPMMQRIPPRVFLYGSL